MNYSEKRLVHRIERLKKRIDNLQSRKDALSVHGMWQLGYYEGIVSELENILDEIRDGNIQIMSKL